MFAIGVAWHCHYQSWLVCAAAAATRTALTAAACCVRVCLCALQVTCSCLAVYGVHWFERRRRLRYKEQLPPAVAAQQGHIYALPPGLIVAQVSYSTGYCSRVMLKGNTGCTDGLRMGVSHCKMCTLRDVADTSTPKHLLTQ